MPASLDRLPRRLLPLAVLASVALVGCSDNGATGPSGTSTAAPGVSSSATTMPTTTIAAAPVDQTAPATANGLKLDADDNLWIASIGSNAILHVDGATGEILRRIDTPAGSGPDDLVIAEDGTIYWTGFLNGDVGVIERGSDDARVIANVGEAANPIAIRSDGTIIVGRAVTSTGLLAIDPEGDGEPIALEDPGDVNSFDVAPDGTLYGPHTSPAEALAIDAQTGETLRTVASLPGRAFALRWHDEALYVLILDDGAKVYRVEIADGTVELFGETGLVVADNLAVADDGRVYVSGFNSPVVVVLSPDGQPERTINIGS